MTLRQAHRWLARHVVFPIKDIVTRKRTLEALTELERTQWLPRDALRDLQWLRLQQVLRHACDTVPYYQRVFSERGVRPSDVTDWKAFSELVPILTKDLVQQHGLALRSTRPGPSPMMARTSGSTGRPTLVWGDWSSRSYYNASGVRGRRWWDIDVGSTELKFWGVSTSFETSLWGKALSVLRRVKDVALGVVHVSAFDMSYSRLMAHYRLMVRWRPELLFGYGTALYIFAEFIKRNSLSLDGYHPRVVIYTSEMLYPSQKQVIQDVFGAPLVSEYGCVELGVLGYECPHRKMHLSEEIAYFEIVNQRMYDDSCTGELVVTGLVNQSFPLIRYKLGDIVQFSQSDTVCACGRQLAVLDKLIGRSNDLVRKPSGEYIHPELFDYVMRYQSGVRRYRIIEKDVGYLEVQLEMSGELHPAQRDDLRRGLEKSIGEDVTFEITSVPRLESDPSGKFRWVVSRAEANMS
jgi:phenylacetate-CoA ligase